MLKYKYREDKTTQAAAHFIKLSNGTINHMKLIKLLYFSDRCALLKWGRPITFDGYVSMSYGPVLSFTLDKINYNDPCDDSSYWRIYISERCNNEVSLKKEAPKDKLSRAEENLLDKIWDEFGHMNEWELVDISHKLPEWQDPEGSSRPIEIRDIFLAGGLSDEDFQEAMDELVAEQYIENLLT
jgi:uncharacterized phage-associated protein